MCIYGIELLEDNVEECRDVLLSLYKDFLLINESSDWYKAGKNVLNLNIIHGDALTIQTINGKPIEFPEWSYLGAGKYHRRDFKFENLTERSSFKNTLFELLEEDQLFTPTKTHASMLVKDIK